MDRFAAMEAFVAVAELLSFTKAAQSQHLPKTTISRLVNSLEARLRVKLLNRTTRHVSLTPEGVLFYEEAVRLLDELRQSEAAVSSATAIPRGRLRIDMPHSVANGIVIPALPQFYALYPDVTLELTCSERMVNLVAEGADCVLRANITHDDSLIARRVGTLEVVTCASPDYIRRHGLPRSSADIADHAVIAFYYTTARKLRTLSFMRGNESVPAQGNCVAGFSDVQSCLVGAIAGLGVTQVPSFLLNHSIASGAIERVMPDYAVEGIDMYALYPQTRKHSATVRAFVTWVGQIFRSL